ncbi:uncharacterized protein LOC144114692 isoform X1 [Amblyomma americanum]
MIGVRVAEQQTPGMCRASRRDIRVHWRTIWSQRCQQGSVNVCRERYMTSPATLRCAVPAGEGTSTQEACVGSIHDPFVWNILSCTARMEIFKLVMVCVKCRCGGPLSPWDLSSKALMPDPSLLTSRLDCLPSSVAIPGS